MTIEREFDPETTLQMPRPVLIDPELEEVDPEKTLVREDWESTVIRRVAPHVAAVQSAVGEDTAAEAQFGWEAQTLRLLSRAVTREQGE